MAVVELSLLCDKMSLLPLFLLGGGGILAGIYPTDSSARMQCFFKDLVEDQIRTCKRTPNEKSENNQKSTYPCHLSELIRGHFSSVFLFPLSLKIQFILVNCKFGII